MIHRQTDLVHAGVHSVHAHNAHEHSSDVASVERDRSVGHGFRDNPLQSIRPDGSAADGVIAAAQAIRLQHRINLEVPRGDICAQRIVSGSLKMAIRCAEAGVGEVIYANVLNRLDRKSVSQVQDHETHKATCLVAKDRAQTPLDRQLLHKQGPQLEILQHGSNVINLLAVD